MLSFLLLSILPAAFAGETCNTGTSCFLPCRSVAISCVRGKGHSTANLEALMKCVIEHSKHVTACNSCIQGELKKMSEAERLRCLQKGEIESCTDVEKEDACKKQVKLTCEWKHGKCTVKKPEIKNCSDVKDEDICNKQVDFTCEWKHHACSVKSTDAPISTDAPKFNCIGVKRVKKCPKDKCVWKGDLKECHNKDEVVEKAAPTKTEIDNCRALGSKKCVSDKCIVNTKLKICVPKGYSPKCADLNKKKLCKKGVNCRWQKNRKCYTQE